MATLKHYSNIYIWNPELCPHTRPLFVELRANARVSDVWYIADREFPNRREQLGLAFYPGAEDRIVVGPDKSAVENIVSSSPPDSIHLFVGIHWVPSIVSGIAAAIRHKRHFGVWHEPRVYNGVKGVARLAHSWLTERAIRAHADFILAVGAHGPTWFQMAGYDSHKIFPFAYFLTQPNETHSKALGAAAKAPYRVAFLGRLEQSKGFDLFLGALPRVKSSIEAYIAGNGSLARNAQEAADRDSRVRYLGTIPMDEVFGFLAKTDILVLPSVTIDDGWGAVVSEALMAGAAVVVSEKVGASVLLKDLVRGTVVRAGSSLEIAKAIDEVVDRKLLDPKVREERSRWAIEHLGSSAGVVHFLQILDHLYGGAERPLPYFEQDMIADVRAPDRGGNSQ
jgi:glycosyltransferase involved in cell wall biosynthesis